MSNNNNLEAYGQEPSCQDLTKTSTPPDGDVPRLSLRHVLGFNGKVVNGLVVHPSGKHLVYAVGRHVIVEQIAGPCPGHQEMLVGHDGDVSSLAVSPDGQYIVSGQTNAIRETRSPVILWDWCSRRKLLRRNLHKAATAVLTFTCSPRYFVSLGSPDDGEVCVWDATDRKPLLCKTSQVRRVGPTLVVKASHVNQAMFITVGESYGRIWSFDCYNSKLAYTELNFGPSVRKVISVEIGDKDNNEPTRVFCGTSTGSIILFHGESGVLMTEILNPLFSLGVTCLTYTRMLDDDTYCMLVGTGEGKVGHYTLRLETKNHKVVCRMDPYPGTSAWQDPQGGSCVTSISKLGVGQQFYVGFYQSHMQRFTLEPWGCQLVRTCSNTAINDACFARGTDDLLVTAEPGKVRVYNLKVMLEVRRYVRVNRNCVSVCVRHDGTHIFTGWDGGDVLVLGFEPKGLGLHVVYNIGSAHRHIVSCMALTSNSDRLVTGGRDGFVSVWRLVEDLDMRGRRLRQGIRAFHFVDQKGPITRLRVSTDDQTCIASSQDGTAVSYSLVSGLRLQFFSWECGLTSVSFGQTDLQVVTSSTDGRLQWWDVIIGQKLRDLQGSSSGGVHSTDTEPVLRQLMVSAGDDRLVKLWRIEEGEVNYVGEGHSDTITLVKFGPCGTVLLSASKDGSVCIWDLPPEK